MRGVWILLSSAGIALQLLLISVLLKGALRRFRVLFTYAVVLFLTTVVEAAAFYNPQIYESTSRYYWTIDAIRQALIFLLVLSFIHQSLDQSEKRGPVRRLLWGSASLFVLVSLYVTRDPKIGHWMTNLSRNLGFLAVILNLILWAVLIQFRRADHVLLMVSGGMGIQMAGKAIGHSLRQLYPLKTVAGDLIIVLTHLLCLYIWWYAFRRFEQRDVGGGL